MSGLEEIKDRYVDALLNDGYFKDTITITSKDYLWIIQQAERVEELESEKEQYKLWFHRQKDKTVELYQQNDRYKQVLEDIRIYMETDASIYMSDDQRLEGIHNVLVKHYKALEGEAE